VGKQNHSTELQRKEKSALKKSLLDILSSKGYKLPLSPVTLLDQGTDITALEREAWDGKLVVKDADFYRQFTQTQLSMFAHKYACYGLPTTELVAWIKMEIGEAVAIEIGSGTGALGRALGIPMTDSKQQERRDIQAYYASIRQPVIQYPEDVEKLDYQEAILKYKPDVVIGSWITQKYREDHHELGGNVDGVEEEWVLANCKKYILVGHGKTHWGKPILIRDHQDHRTDFIFSRSMTPKENFIKVWN